MKLERIAYVEDDEDIRTLVELTLSGIGGYDVAAFSSAAEALAGIEAFDPQIILTDVMMPGMDGPQLLQHLRADPRFASIPVAFVTARSLTTERREMLALGSDGIITKPFDPLTLSDEVLSIWRRATATRTAA